MTILNKYQRIAADSYENGEYSHINDERQAGRCGDSLFEFIITELEDVEDGVHADGRISRAIAQLGHIRYALRDS